MFASNDHATAKKAVDIVSRKLTTQFPFPVLTLESSKTPGTILIKSYQSEKDEDMFLYAHQTNQCENTTTYANATEWIPIYHSEKGCWLFQTLNKKQYLAYDTNTNNIFLTTNVEEATCSFDLQLITSLKHPTEDSTWRWLQYKMIKSPWLWHALWMGIVIVIIVIILLKRSGYLILSKKVFNHLI
jgi:hypothetical protein